MERDKRQLPAGAGMVSNRKHLLRKLPGRRRTSFGRKFSYGFRVGGSYVWQRLLRRTPSSPVELIIAVADHFEPAFMAHGLARAAADEQQRRIESWCREYPHATSDWRDRDGHPFVHTYFYPAEQYDRGLLARLAEHCQTGWGEIEIHLHHGVQTPDTAENTRRQLIEFRDILATEHGCLCYLDGSGPPKYAFVHGNFTLANSAGGAACGVDSEMQVLADTGCFADMTFPAAAFHPSQTAKINSLYECTLPLDQRAPQRRGRDLQAGRPPGIFPLIVQGPLMLRFSPSFPVPLSLENGAITGPNPLSLQRLQLWRKAAISVQGRPDWLFIKLHCHSMDPRQREAVLGAPLRQFLRDLVEGAPQRGETLHFVTAREMVNIILAACDGREGNPGEYRDYRLKRVLARSPESRYGDTTVIFKG